MRQLKITQQITSRETISLAKYLQEISSIPLLTPEEEIALPVLIQQGDQKALKRFVEGNLRFVISVAKQYQGSSGERLDDLINAGNEGLIKAAKRFDTSRGFKFISYAVWWIRQSIMEHLTENGKSIRLPSNKVGVINKIKNISSALEQEFQRTPTPEEISERLSEKTKQVFTPEDVEALLNINNAPTSLDTKVGEDSEGTLLDLIPTEGLESIGVFLKNQDLQFVIKKALDKRLTPREKEVIILFFGLFGEQPRLLEEIGDRLDLTRERVRQIKEKALRKLKHYSGRQEMQEYI